MITRTLYRQRGVSLIIVLLLLLIMTMLGIASFKSTIMQEKMSSNLLDRSIAFQAAEAALREAETLAATRPTFPASGACDSNGLCPAPTGTATDRWRDSTTVWHSATVSLGGLNASAPQYIIEPLGSAPNWVGCDREIPAQPNCFSPRYRITARSSATNRAQVILQVNYAAP